MFRIEYTQDGKTVTKTFEERSQANVCFFQSKNHPKRSNVKKLYQDKQRGRSQLKQGVKTYQAAVKEGLRPEALEALKQILNLN